MWRVVTRLLGRQAAVPSHSGVATEQSAAPATPEQRTAAEVSAAEVPHLLRSLRHRRAAVRIRAAYLLGEVGRKEAIGPLLASAADATPGVRRAVLSALWRLDLDAFADAAVQLAASVKRDELFSDLDAAFEAASGIGFLSGNTRGV